MASSRAAPETLAELVAAFDGAAWEHLVNPLDNRDRLHKFADLPPEVKAAFQLGKGRAAWRASWWRATSRW